MVKSKRKKGENFITFLTNHNKRLLRSGLLREFRNRRYFKKKINPNLQKKKALFGRKISIRREYLKKIGKEIEK